jgi:endonuclease G
MALQLRNQSAARVEQSRQNEFEELTSHFPNRDGYDTNFLGTSLPLPKLDPSIRDQAAELIGKPGETELKYTSFSIVMNKERRQAFYSVVNIDGANIVDRSRDGIGWTIDGRIPRDQQLGNEAYGRNPIDRGHMVRRRDPVWGPKADQANADTFSYTNAGLQHGRLNQQTWLDLENYILDQAKEKDQKLTVFTGPVFADNDPEFDNRGRIDKPTKIPQEFWKMVVWNDPQEGLKGAAFIQSQKDYIGRSLFKTDFDPGAMSVYQLPLEKLEKLTKLDFGDIVDTAQEARLINEVSDAKLPV